MISSRLGDKFTDSQPTGMTNCGHILIVDDEVVIRSLLSELLSEDGYSVATAEDGKRGLEYVNNGQVDLVISDVHMPVMTGPELVTHLHQIDPNLPVIVLNSNPGNDVSRDITSRAAAYLDKPFNLQDLRNTIASVRSRPVKTLP
jgi:CheY-like chemotaxis protein